MTTVAGPRYAPEDPTLPKPWIGLVDGKTGYLYFWNPETNITRYERPSSTSISSSVQVQQSSKRKHRDNSYNDDYGRYNKSSNNGSKFASESRNYEEGSCMIYDAPDSYPLNNEKLISQQQGGSYMIHDTPASYPLNVDNLISLQQEKRAYEEMEMVTYFREVDESDGFDVNIKTSMIGGIQPVNLYIEDMRVKCVGFAKFAIEAFNTREKDSEGKLKFGTLLKATFQVGYAYIYYLTFVAENLVKRCFDIYQAVVKKPCRGENKVPAFRPKPQGSRPIKWYWDDRCCGRNGDREKFK